jgi:hypothetical protein
VQITLLPTSNVLASYDNSGPNELSTSRETIFTMSDDGTRLFFEDSILDCPTKGTSMSLPIAATRRLDEMARVARRSRPTRNELLAVLIATTPLDERELRRRIDEYRDMSIGDVLPTEAGTADRSDSVVVPLRKPGRPPGPGN